MLQKDDMVSATIDSDSTLVKPGKQWFNWTTAAAGTKVSLAPGVYVPASLTPAGDNILVNAKLQLNGHDRFSERGARYFNLVQPFQHHENVPTAGVYVYSFGLKPEEHQPSGTCNMSRIDNATLQFSLKSGMGACRIKVFAINYNVLRIMSGQQTPKATKSYMLRRSGKFVVGNRYGSQCICKPVASRFRL